MTCTVQLPSTVS